MLLILGMQLLKDARVHEEAREDDLQIALGDLGETKNMHLNLDPRTGFFQVNIFPVFPVSFVELFPFCL